MTEESLHVDVYRDGEEVDTRRATGPIEPAVALTHAEEHLAEHAERYISRFEQWHAIDRTDR